MYISNSPSDCKKKYEMTEKNSVNVRRLLSIPLEKLALESKWMLNRSKHSGWNRDPVAPSRQWLLLKFVYLLCCFSDRTGNEWTAANSATTSNKPKDFVKAIFSDVCRISCNRRCNWMKFRRLSMYPIWMRRSAWTNATTDFRGRRPSAQAKEI